MFLMKGQSSKVPSTQQSRIQDQNPNNDSRLEDNLGQKPKQPERIYKSLTPEQQNLLVSFNQKPVIFLPPPRDNDPTKGAYRENISFIEPITDNYSMFNSKYSIKTGRAYPQALLDDPQTAKNPKNLSVHSMFPEGEAGNTSILSSVFDIKFLTYTLYTAMMDGLKYFRQQQQNEQKIKLNNVAINDKLKQIYTKLNQLKQLYRRISIIHLLQKQIVHLQHETKQINEKLSEIMQQAEINKRNQLNGDDHNNSNLNGADGNVDSNLNGGQDQ